MSKVKWWASGVRFECQGSGKCCLSRGAYGHVYLTLADRQRLARHHGISTLKFTKTYCQKKDGYFQLARTPGMRDESACRFLEGKSCGIYDARPTQCRTWPFWPENMSPKAWAADVVGFCPGVGKGKVVSASEIHSITTSQKKSEDKL